MATRVSTLTELTAAAAAGGDMLAIEDGNDAKYITLDSIRTSVPHGNIVVTTNNGTSTVYTCTADGTTNDQATIASAVATAIADMPATIEFGAGDYGIDTGTDISPVQGSKGLTIKGAGANSTRIRWTPVGNPSPANYVAFRILPSVLPTVGVYANYLHDIMIDGISFYDDDPDTHAATTEQTHGIQIKYTVNATIQNCLAEHIGDEGFDFAFVAGGKIINNTTIATPSPLIVDAAKTGAAGAAAINVQNSENIVIANNVCHGSATVGTTSTLVGSSGIGLENVASTPDDECKHITISNNVTRDFESIGITINNVDTDVDMSHITVSANVIDNVTEGIALDGSGVKKFINITGNVITNVTDGIDSITSLTATTDLLISSNTIDTCSGRGVLIGGTRITIADNNISNTTLAAVYLSGDSIDSVISGGIMENCGGTSAAVIEAFAYGKEVTVDGVTILSPNNANNSRVIYKCERILNTVIKGGTPSYHMIDACHEVKNSTFNGGISLNSTATGGSIVGNTMDMGGTDILTTAIILADANHGYIVKGNFIDTTNGTTRTCINVADNSDYNIITDNICVCDTAASAIIVSGTGTSNGIYVAADNIETTSL